MEQTLKGQVAVITGASGGLGAHFAKVLARAGASVALTARRLDLVEAHAGGIAGEGGRAMALKLDVADAAAIGPAFDEVEASLGPISILVNNAGVGGEGLALDLSIEDWDRTFDVNVRGVFFAAQQAAKRMIASGVAERGEARVVNIASIASHTVLPGLSAYCASKASVAMLTRSLAREWARKGVAVNAICPGYIETDINADWFHTEGGQKQMKGFPRRRLMEAEDLDASLLMLCGPAARAITGTVITIDDGQSLPGGG
ncbi:short-chain dehydrogenase [Phenylobacterium sp. Root77]|uniref:SDR family NAD(P)-dependent oxidoreductase n=1 Tax=unclassified Phenylobacterium TaxID=2640670 RepID=UPI0006FB2252|nr:MULTISPECIES: SDR family NAD(P)-dependent oxidoreductase [unclassified Phenylobacterium]KQW71681.1 short-chain dehydrogenase [Phenylobacterium sp. Root1277]KQW94601.1 short-chain dehydrogenase [Phenylobacterium sp. Root1290]KRC44294.1 short-chain dehydrogenase [Phenylobacterium sp. Root77]